MAGVLWGAVPCAWIGPAVLKRDCGRGTLSLTPTGQRLAFNARQVLELLDGPPARIEPQEQKLFAGCEKAPAARSSQA